MKGCAGESVPTTNSDRCNDVTLILQHCFPYLESFIINCKPFYFPRELASFILVGSFNQGVGDSISALVDVSLSKTLNPELLPVAVSRVYECNRIVSRFG